VKIMLRLFKNKKAQNTAEYAILIGLVIAVVIGLQTYVKRGVQGRFKAEVDDMATGTANLSSDSGNATRQYEPYYLSSNYTTETVKDTRNLSGTAKSPTRDVDTNVTQGGKQELLYTP
jgi:Flp pilus assembly pilin Flp